MIIDHKGTETVIGGAAGPASAFAINNSAMAFKILSSKLYNDKVLAPIRELSCNAWDAHVAAGKAHVPFEIDLPNTFDPMFRIKDHGVGLDDQGIHELYCRYFGSNKSQSNEFVGAMGLGSKSPFCYTDGFTVISNFNGMKRTYDAHLSEEGMPEVVLLSEEETTDENGLEVSFPVPPSDFYEFQNKARVALEFIQPRPVVNLKSFYFTDTEYVVKTDRWAIRKNSATHQSYHARAIQGMVAYNVGSIDESRTTAAQRQILSMPVDLFFNIGDLDVAASRETLDNTKHTVNNVLALVDEVYKGLVDELKAKINTAQTAWEARLILREMHNSPLKEVVKQAEKDGEIFGTYDNFTLTKCKPFVNQMDYEHLTIAKFTRNKKSAAWANKSFLFKQKGSDAYAVAVAQIQQGLQDKEIMDIPFEASPNMLFVMNDIKFGGEKYIHYLLQQDEAQYPGIEEVYYITKATTQTDQLSVVSDAARLVAVIGNPKVVNMSTLKDQFTAMVDKPKPVYAKQPRERKSLLMLNFQGKWSSFFGKNTYSFWTSWEKPEDEDIDASTVNYYLVLQPDQKPVWGGFHDCGSMVEFLNKIRSTQQFGMSPNQNIFGLKPNSKLIGTPGWVELGSYVEAKAKSIMTEARQKELSLLLGGERCEYPTLWATISTKKNLPLNSPARKFAEEYQSVYQASIKESNKTLVNTLTTLKSRGMWKPTVTKFADWASRESQLKAIYPLLHVLGSATRYSRQDSRDMQNVIDYFALVDDSNTRKQKERELNLMATEVAVIEEMENVSIN